MRLDNCREIHLGTVSDPRRALEPQGIRQQTEETITTLHRNQEISASHMKRQVAVLMHPETIHNIVTRLHTVYKPLKWWFSTREIERERARDRDTRRVRPPTHTPHTCVTQISTTKGTGGDLIVLEEAAYVEPGFFYETVAPLLLIGNTSLIAISTLTSEINFYTRLLRMRDKVTGLPLFTTLSIQLACKQCIEEGKVASCVHMLHLVPRWQSSDRHVKLKTIMQDRPDLIESELSGLAFDSNQQIFKTAHIETMFAQPPPIPVLNEAVYIFIDPAAGGPQSDYAVLSVTRQKGLLTVSIHTHTGEKKRSNVKE